jgi:hypothetical protein
MVSRNSAVGTAIGYGPDFESQKGQKFSVLHEIQTGSGARTTSYPMGTWGLSPGVKRPWCEAYHLPPTSSEVEKTWIFTSTPPYIFAA